MKMRRIRVRSLLAGCISCLRCVWTSGLTCRSSPFASPRTAVLSSRISFALQLARFFYDVLWSLLCSPSAARQQKATDLFHGVVSVHIHLISGAYLRRLSPRSSRHRTYLSLRRTGMNIGLKTRKHCRIHSYKPSLRYCQKFTSPPQAAV